MTENLTKAWLNLLPPFFPAPKDDLGIWDTKFCDPDFQASFNSISEAVSCVMGKPSTSIPLASEARLRKNLTEWFLSAPIQDTLTFPPSKLSLERALILSLKEEHADALSALACLFPSEMITAIQSSPEINGNWARILLLSPLAPIKQDEVNISSSLENSEQPQTPDAKKSRSKGDLSTLVKKQSSLLQLLLDDIESSDPLAVQKEKWNGALKKSILSEKGVGPEAINYWFEDVFFPGSCGLSKASLERIVSLTSDHLRPSLHHPAVALKSLFGHMRGMPFGERKYFLEDFLPAVVNTELWGFGDRFSLLQSLLEGTETRPWAFNERLSLWKGLGGDLNEKGSLGKSSDVFSDHTTTATEWLTKQNHEAWSEILAPQPRPSKKM